MPPPVASNMPPHPAPRNGFIWISDAGGMPSESLEVR
jgi:hypothetical protein